MSATQEEDKKPGDQGPAHINLKVKGQVLFTVFFSFNSFVNFYGFDFTSKLGVVELDSGSWDFSQTCV